MIQEKKKVTLSIAFLLTAWTLLSGCNPSDSASPLPGSRSSNVPKKTKTGLDESWKKLTGTWRGVCYVVPPGELTSIREIVRNRRLEIRKLEEGKESKASRRFFKLEINEKYFAFPGTEICHLTVTKVKDHPNAQRCTFRMIPDPENITNVTLKGEGLKYRLTHQADGKVQILGISNPISEFRAVLEREKENSN